MSSLIPQFRMHNEPLKPVLMKAVTRVIESNWYILGKEVAEFEREFAAYCEVPHCVGVGNGTDALELALRALGVKAGDPVILAANAGFYGSTAVRIIGAEPRYVDIDSLTLTLSVNALNRALSHNTAKAIIVTHLYGQLADVEEIVDIAGKAGIPVIEDCAQAHGGLRNGKRAGSFGAAGCFSFYPTKNLGAVGDGGAIITGDGSVMEHLRQLQQYGWADKYRIEVPGGRNSRLDEIQAAVLREKLPYLDVWNTERRAIADCYNKAFAKLPVRCPPSLGDDYVAHLYVMRLTDRDTFCSHLAHHGIATDIHYPIPDQNQIAYPLARSQGALPVTVEACQSAVSLPCFPGLTDSEQQRVITAVESFF